MQIANVMVAIGGDTGNIVPKYRVTAAEIAVLQAIHGEDSVFDVEPLGTIRTTNKEELRRLHEVYAGTNGEQSVAVSTLFPGAAARVFENLDELDIPDEFYKAKERLTAKDDAPAQDTGKSLDDMTKAELVEYAEKNGITVDKEARKADIIAAIEAASGEGDEDDIADMPGNEVFK